MKKFIAVFLLITTLFSCLPVVISAESNGDEDVQVYTASVDPRLNNGSSCSLDFYISSSGLALVTVDYSGIPSTFQRVTVKTYIQKKSFIFFWNKIDIGQADNIWVDTSTALTGSFTHQIQLGDTGTYRAVIEITFSGTGGADDVIEDKIERTYG